MSRLLYYLLIALVLIGLTAWWAVIDTKEQTSQLQNSEHSFPPGFDTFPARWNQEIRQYLLQQQESTRNPILLKRIAQRLEEGDVLELLDEQDVPEVLQWEKGENEPEIGDPNAIKGGNITLWNPSAYPNTFRGFGPNSFQYFNFSLYTNNEMKLVGIHPTTQAIIPGIASQWAYGADGRTVYFQIDPSARYSNGKPIHAIDVIVHLFLRTSPHARDPYALKVFREAFSHIRTYKGNILAITVPQKRPLLAFICSKDLSASEPSFYHEFGADFPTRYQWRIPPTTGGYSLDPAKIERGRSLSLSRIKTWWAADKKYYRYSCNVDTIQHLFGIDEARAFELLRHGKIDLIRITKPSSWHERLETPEVIQGYIEKTTFYTLCPQAPYGIYLNTAHKPLDSLDVRLGVQHALAINAALKSIFTGDSSRLKTYSEGYGDWSLKTLPERKFSPEKARNYFHSAGFTARDKDGILMRPDGTRLSISLSYSLLSPLIHHFCSFLQQKAKLCGLEIRLNSTEMTICSQEVYDKKHDAAFWAWPLSYPLPDHLLTFHSSEAYDAEHRTISQTDNIFSIADPELDQALLAEATASTSEELRRATHAVQRRIFDLAIWVPGWETPYTRLAYWRWLRFPNTKETRFSIPTLDEPQEAHLYWIDPKIKEETAKAKAADESFPEVDQVIQQPQS